MPPAGMDHRSVVLDENLPRALARLAAPAVLATALVAGFGIADTIFVGHGLGAAPLAALSSSAFLLWGLDSIALAVSVGLTALVARRVGEEDEEGLRRLVPQGLLIGGILGAGIAFFAPMASTEFPVLMNIPPEAAGHATSYLRALFLGAPAIFCFHAVAAVLRGAGDTRTPLWLLGGALVTNLVLDPCLLFGLGPFPRLEVTGVAIATVTSHAVAGALGLVILTRRKLLAWTAWGAWTPNPRAWWRVLAIGSPASANAAFFCLVYVVIARITSDFGTEALAALGVGHKGEAPCYFLGVGFATAVAPLVGQALGAGQPERAEKAAWLAVRFACFGGLIWTLVLLALPRLIGSVFTTDPAVLDVARNYLIIVGLSQAFMTLDVVLEGAFAGAGDTVPPMVFGLPLAAARIPLAWFLAHVVGMGAEGIWIAISASTIAKGLLLAAWFRRGAWKHRAVPTD